MNHSMAALVVGLAAVLAVPAGAQNAALERVDSLVALGRLQEAVWAARAAGDTAAGDRILDRLDSILRSQPRSAEPLSLDSQGVSFTYRLEYGDGVAAIFKVDGSDIFCRSCGADREIATYRLDRLLRLDLTPMTVPARILDSHGDTLVGSAMYFVRDASSPRDVGALKPDRLRFLDALIGNSDRHQSNWLVVDGRTVAIDHNRAFEYHLASKPKTCWETEIDSIYLPGALGTPFRRARSLPDDSLVDALGKLDPHLVTEFLSMRPRVVERIEQRTESPTRTLPHEDCQPDL